MKIRTIQEAVMEHYKVPPALFFSRTRTPKVARPRQIAMMLAREYGTGSLPMIGKAFGGRDHTTVLHAIRVMPGRIAASPKLQADMEAIRQKISGNSVGYETNACSSPDMCKMGSSVEGASM